MLINSWFSKFILKSAYLFRVVYSYLIYSFLYVFFLKGEYIDLFQVIPRFKEDYPNTDLINFERLMSGLKWLPEKKAGLLDFTYLNYKFFLSETFTKKWGRDCDDFAHHWYNFLSKNAPASRKVYKILLTTWSFKCLLNKSHFIVVVIDGVSVTLYLNNRPMKVSSGKILNDVLLEYSQYRSKKGLGYEAMAWCVAKSTV